MLKYYLLICCTFLSACSVPQHTDVLQTNEDNCAYYNFLVGNSFELRSDYENALTSYFKAQSCDPHSSYLQNKIPLVYIKMGEYHKAQAWIETHINDYSKDKGLALLLANLYNEDGDEEKAISIYEKMLKNNRDQDVILQLGSLYHSLGLYKEAENLFGEIIENDHNSYLANLLLARTLAADNQLQLAEVHYKNALRANWSNALAYEVATFLSEIGEHEKSLNIYNEILKIQQDDEMAFALKLGELIILNREQQALSELDARRNYTQNPEYFDSLVAQQLLEKGDQELALPLLQKMAERYSHPWATYTLALIYYDQNDYDKALQWVRLVPHNEDTRSSKIQLQIEILLKQNKAYAAINLLEDVITEDPSPYDYNLLGSIYSQHLHQSMAAEKVYLEGLDRFPGDSMLSYQYALLLDKNKRYEESIKVMQEVLKQDPENAEALNFIGYTWANTNQNLLEALNYTTKASEIMPDNGYIRDSVGWCYFKLGLYNEATNHLLAANMLAPNDPSILEHLGDVYRAQSLVEQARTAYKKAIHLYTKLGYEDKVLLLQKKLHTLTTPSEALSLNS